ncbi:hypothetical protein AB0M92_18900 [Streptomyces sp. NPDC051582]|uniref:hypothetical protein n=1 Tax=Streptomyces sp. NPDC051582 TaxID=3155167 RepID=UPI0034144467
MSRYDDLSDQARLYLNNCDEIELAEMCARYGDRIEQLREQAEQAERRASDTAKKWGYTFGLLAQSVDHIPPGDLRDRIRAALNPEEPTP